MNCPCGSSLDYANCCQVFHQNNSFPLTAEALMRSRYAAYVLPNGTYLMQTTHPAKRYLHDADDMQQWGEENTWEKLEIVATPEKNKVEFKAYYNDKNGQPQLHHEISTFKKLDGKWYYYTSKFIHI